MNLASWVVLFLVALAVGRAIWQIYRQKKNHGCSCCKDCSTCGLCCKEKEQSENE